MRVDSKTFSPTPNAVRVGAAAIALVALGLLLLLGHAVGRAPDPAWLMTAEASWVDHSTLIAWWITWCGYAYVIVPVCLVLIAVAIVHRPWRDRTAYALLAVLLAWRGADFFQKFFMRPRRLDWVVKHELSYSFPSSHAAIATGFYLLLAIFVWKSSRRFGRPAASALGLLAVAILWSRLALGAHYLTDLAGGVLWGIVVVAALACLWPRNVFEGPPLPSLE